MAKGQGASHTWRKLITAKDEIEHNIWWQVKAGNCSFWFDNWTKLGALWHVENTNAGEEELKVKSFIYQRNWDREKLLSKLSEEMTEYIMESIKPPVDDCINNVAW